MKKTANVQYTMIFLRTVSTVCHIFQKAHMHVLHVGFY
ncbi:hypothetical protein B4129_3274 [Bacillus safensis]|nr:hypothetical protein B4129_3274 [Bacillus safensis]